MAHTAPWLARSHTARLLPVVAALCANAALAADAPAPPDPQRQAEIVGMVRQDCGSCHGSTLKGGLGPALLPDALRGKDAQALKFTILYGRPGTPMPPWKDFVSDAEAGWIVQMLLKGLPDGR